LASQLARVPLLSMLAEDMVAAEDFMVAAGSSVMVGVVVAREAGQVDFRGR
jgi:hypothetical protein